MESGPHKFNPYRMGYDYWDRYYKRFRKREVHRQFRRTSRPEIELGLEEFEEARERSGFGNSLCDCFRCRELITYDGEFYYWGNEIYTGVVGNEVW